MSFGTTQPIALAASAGTPRGIGSTVNGGDVAASATVTGRSSAWRSGQALSAGNVTLGPAGTVTFGAVLRTFGAVSRTFGSRCAVELGAKVAA